MSVSGLRHFREAVFKGAGYEPMSLKEVMLNPIRRGFEGEEWGGEWDLDPEN